MVARFAPGLVGDGRLGAGDEDGVSHARVADDKVVLGIFLIDPGELVRFGGFFSVEFGVWVEGR